MANPWEQDYNSDGAPWEQDYDRQTNDLPAYDSYPDFINWTDRAVIKNFASHNPQGSVAWLKKKYPQAAFRVVDGEIEASEGGDWYKLDPGFLSSIANPAELFRDAADIAGDVAGGIGEGLATSAGFLAGLPAGPVTAYAGGALANSAASTITEGARQSIGSEVYGIPDNYNGADLGIAAATGLASPLLFGAGKVPLKKLNQQALSRLSKGGAEVTQEQVDKLARGAGGYIWDESKQRVAPKIGSLLSGADAYGMKNFANNMEQIDAMTENPRYADQVISDAQDKLTSFMGNRKNQIGQEIRDSIRGSDSVRIDNVIKAIDDEIAMLSDDFSDMSQQRVAALKAWRDQVIKRTYPDETRQVHQLVRKETPVPDLIETPSVEYQTLPKKVPGTLGVPTLVPGESKVAYGRKVVPQEPKVEYVPEVVTETFNPGTDGYYDRTLGKHVKKPTSFGDATDGAGALELNRNLTKAADWGAPYSNDISRVSRKAQEQLRASMEEASPTTQDGKNAFKQLLAIEELLGTMTRVDEKGKAIPAAREAFERELGKAPGRGKTTREAGLAAVEDLGYDPGNTRELVSGYNFARNDSLFPVSSGGSTSTTRTNSLREVGNAVAKTLSAAGLLGGMSGSATTGLLATPLLLSGPKTMRGVIRANNKANYLTNAIMDAGPDQLSRRYLIPSLGSEILEKPFTEDRSGYQLLDY